MTNIGPYEMLLSAFIGLFFIWPWWRIFSRAGFPGWYALSLLVPLLNLFTLFYLAFAEWPVLRTLSEQGSDPQVT